MKRLSGISMLSSLHLLLLVHRGASVVAVVRCAGSGEMGKVSHWSFALKKQQKVFKSRKMMVMDELSQICAPSSRTLTCSKSIGA